LVFSLFRKKNPQPSKKPDARPAPGKSPTTKPTGPSVTKPSAAPAAARSSAAPEVDSPSLDFTGFTPSAKAKPAPAAKPSPETAQARSQREPDSILSVEVTAASGDVAPVIEETAILFANGQAEQALAALQRSVREDDIGAQALQCWLMLFEVHQHLGRREDFESLALEFVVKFERSAPAWRDGAAEARANPALLTGGTGYCAFVGAVSAASAAEFEKLRALGQKQQMIRVDFGRIQSIDGAGAQRLCEALAELRAGGKEVVLTGEARLLELLEGACQPGNASADRGLWELLFEVYRWFGRKERFEEAAVNYAVTFEVSPPSWESGAAPAVKTRQAAASGETAGAALALSGDVTAAGEALVKELRDWAAANSMLVVDLSRVRRVDFVSAGVMLNALSQLRQAGTTIQIRGTNEMIAALFEVMGISKVASVIRRK
jgi:anti-anti-sigma regulatory factor